MQHNGAEAAGDAVDWAAVRAAYEAGEVPLSRIYAEHGLTRGRLQYRREKEGWKVRPPVAQSGRPTAMRRPIEAALILIARLIEAHVERLLAAPGPVPEEELAKVTELTRAAEGLLREDNRRRELARRAADRKTSLGTAAGGGQGRSSAKSAMDGGRSKEEELRAADEAFMRAELKRRTDVLAAALRRGEISLDRGDDGGAAPGEA